jgi:type IV pilus assembly protein PilQ
MSIFTRIRSVTLLCTLLIFSGAGAQDYFARLDSLLAVKAKEIPALDEKVSISVSDVSLEEFLRGVANSSGLNLDVRPGLNFIVVNNFVNVRVRDMLVYVCRQFELELVVVGNIISVSKRSETSYAGTGAVKWDDENELVTLDFTNMPVEQAIREITLKTGANVILAPGSTEKMISGYIGSKPLKNALEKLAFSNGFTLHETEDNFFILEPDEKPQTIPDQMPRERSARNTRSGSAASSGQFTLEIVSTGPERYSINAENAPIPVILKEFSEKSGFGYFLSSKVDAVVTLQITNETTEGIFQTLFSGSDISFKQSNGIYLIGERNILDFNEHRVIPLQNRSIDKLLESLPEDMTKNLNIIEFTELNSLLVSGPEYQVETFNRFIREIDQVVPVVMIEVIILYVNKTITVATGIEAGLADGPVSTQGTLFPGVDVQVGAGEINKILNNMGWINLGQVTPNFYVSLQALEQQGMVDIQSTPKLATLNGHEATMAIGNTEYYLEEQTHLYGTQNPQQTTSQEYKAIQAELSVKIRPVISADEQITLEIEVRQSDFTERISKTAPPGSVNRDFTSVIRVKNEEMILLGGLMEKRKSDSGSGTPILSRIPIIKWIFSSRKREDSDSKLSVLIKPTIIH